MPVSPPAIIYNSIMWSKRAQSRCKHTFEHVYNSKCGFKVGCCKRSCLTRQLCMCRRYTLHHRAALYTPAQLVYWHMPTHCNGRCLALARPVYCTGQYSEMTDALYVAERFGDGIKKSVLGRVDGVSGSTKRMKRPRQRLTASGRDVEYTRSQFSTRRDC